MRRTCETCGASYEAKRSTSKYCSKKCNVRATRTRGKLVLVGSETPPSKASALPPAAVDAVQHAADSPPIATTASGIFAATHKELEAAKVVDTPLGQLALHHAARIQFVPETGAGTAALSRELRAVLEAAKATATASGDRLDEIGKRRQRKATSAT